jgi:drug/metabolite transporter (DMT)-like permease
VFRELAKAAALILTILSIYALLGSAFFVTGSTWQHRILSSLETLTMTGCVCFASGLLFNLTTRPTRGHNNPPLTRTLPVQLFFWSLGGAVLMFLLSRYLEVFYVPLLWKNQPY